jgi:cytoskeletal protein CcmA (bactofilin family)
MTGLWFLAALALLPLLALLLPALREWQRPTDSGPLSIDASYARQDEVFADRFRLIAEDWWRGPEASDGLRKLESRHREARPILAAELVGGAEVHLLEEAWTRGDLTLGPRAEARALLSEGSVHLGAGSHVSRWVHGAGPVRLEERCRVDARVTSADCIHLGAGCRSTLLSAPDIDWEGPLESLPIEIPSHARRWLRRRRIPEAGKTWDIPRKWVNSDGTVFIRGDLILDEEADVDFSLVVWGNLYLRKGALVAGDIKAHGDLLVENSAVVGNLCCLGRLVVGAGSSVQGCLRGDDLVWLGDGVIIGRPDSPEAVVGQRVTLCGRGTVHGRIRALSQHIEVSS